MSGAAPVEPGNAGRADYPKMLYHPDGRTEVVADAEAHQKLHEEGWATTPSPIHQKPPASHSPVMSGMDPQALLLRAVIEAVLDERGLTREAVGRLAPTAGHGPPAPEHDKPSEHGKPRR